jgi:hypothetical protein
MRKGGEGLRRWMSESGRVSGGLGTALDTVFAQYPQGRCFYVVKGVLESLL